MIQNGVWVSIDPNSFIILTDFNLMVDLVVQGPREGWAEGTLAPPPFWLFGAIKKTSNDRLENSLVSD